MATYDEQILNFFAEAVSEDIGLSQSMFDVWCVDGAMDVISKMPEELLEKFGNLTADKTTDGYTSNLPLYVLRENGTDGKYVTCRKIDGGLLFEWEQNLATKNDPAWYVKDGKVYVLPTPGASPDAFKVYEVTKPTIDASADSSISYFPNELEKLAAVIYPVIMGKMRQVEKMRRNSQDELEAITTSGYLADFEDALPTFILPASPSLPSLSLVSLGTVPSFNAASLEFDPPTMQTLPTFVEQVINSISDLTAPGDITLPSSGAITLPTYVQKIMDSITDLPSPGDITLPNSGVITFPSLTLPVVSLVSMGTIPDFDSSSLEFDPPTMQTLPTFVEQVINSISDLTAPGDITLPSSGAITFPTLSLPAVPVAILTYTSAGSAPSSTVTVSETLPTYGGPTNVVIDITAIDDKLDSDYQDANLAMAEVSKARATIEEFLGNVRRGVDQFNGDVEKYRTALREEVDEVRAGISSYDSKAKDNFNAFREEVEQYLGNLTKYQNEVNAKLGEYRTDVQKVIDEYLALLRGVVDKYQAESGADVAEFRANLERAIQEARTKIDQEVGRYRAISDSYINEFSAKAQVAIGEYSARVDAVISEYRVKNDAKISEYGQKVNASLGEYRTDVQKALDEYLALLRGVVDKYQSESAADVAEFRANLERAVQKHRAGIEQELGRYGKKADVAINEYLALLRGVVDKYQAEAQADVAEFRANLERAIQKARLLIDQEVNRYRAVSDSYINEFNVKAQATINEFRARVDAVLNEYTQNNNALLDEYSRKAMALINEYTALVQGELSSVQSDMQKAQSYLNEASVRLQTMQNFDNKSAMVRSENNDLWQQYNQGIAAYISKYIPSKVED